MVVDQREKIVKKSIYKFFRINICTKQIEPYISEKLLNGSGSLQGHVPVGVAEKDAGVILCLPDEGFQGLCNTVKVKQKT